jgi:hypothetical protein
MQNSFAKLSRAIYLWDQIERAKRFALLTTDANERARYASVAVDYQCQLDHLLSAETVTADNLSDAVAETSEPDATGTACNVPGQATETQGFLRISGS